jgi:NRPS condensation-like uncharacterized protein
LEEIQAKWDMQANVDSAYPATPLQAGMIAQSLLDSSAYISQTVFKCEDEIDVERLETALKQVCEAHSIMRTRFIPTSSGIYQIVQNQFHPQVKMIDDLNDGMASDLERGFSPNDTMWFRVLVVTKGPHKSHMVLTIHHALYDGWCLGRMVDDISKAYMGIKIRTSPPFKLVVDYVASRNQQEAQEYWKGYLNGFEVGNRINLALSTETKALPVTKTSNLSSEVMRNIASKAQVTLSTVIKAAWARTLQVYTQSDDVVFGNVISGRELPISNIERFDPD